MNRIFDGREYAGRAAKRLKDQAMKFEEKNGRKAKLISIFDPENEASRIYTAMKRKKAEEIGVEFVTIEAASHKSQVTLVDAIEDWNRDETVDGIMVQTPLSGDQELIELIKPTKDVDGMRAESPYLQATVRAVMDILGNVPLHPPLKFSQAHGNAVRGGMGVIAVVGSRGRVGAGVVARLHQLGAEKLYAMDSDSFDLDKLSEADVVISATGVPGLITPEMVKLGVIAIDVGYPKGDFAPEVAEKAAFFTPVPGGVGPVTVVSLFANLLKV